MSGRPKIHELVEVEQRLNALQLRLQPELMGPDAGMARAFGVLLSHLTHDGTLALERRGVALSMRLIGAEMTALTAGKRHEPMAWIHLALGEWAQRYARWREEGSYHDRANDDRLVSCGMLQAELIELQKRVAVFKNSGLVTHS